MYHRPHPTQLDVRNPTNQGTSGMDWVEVDAEANLEISSEVLKRVCGDAEELDYRFALSMQGLRGSSLNAVWTCPDPEYSISDRSVVMEQFVKLYMEKFYSNVSVTSGTSSAEDVIHEALRLHQQFCKSWVETHHRTLSAEVVSTAEALIGMFYQGITANMPREFLESVGITRVLLSRYLRRNPLYSSEFAHCLYHYQTSNEHMRGNRNPSYRAMSKENNANTSALRRMAQMLEANLQGVLSDIRALNQYDILFHRYFIDWHFIAGQMPHYHKEFNGFSGGFQNFFRNSVRAGGRGDVFPPWRTGRIVR